MKDLGLFLFFMIVLWILWFVMVKSEGRERVDGTFVTIPYDGDSEVKNATKEELVPSHLLR
jgi:hypothetical protein